MAYKELEVLRAQMQQMNTQEKRNTSSLLAKKSEKSFAKLTREKEHI
jgi:hypothetical protein